MILLDYKDRRPIYEQVVAKLEELMLLGVMKENEPLLSFDQSEYDPARVCGAGTAGIHLYSEGKGKFCGRQSGNERE